MEKEISRDLPTSTKAAATGTADVQAPSNLRKPNRKRARIVQIVSIVVLVILLVVLWRFLGDRAATAGAGRGGRGSGEVVPVEIAPVTQQDVPIQLESVGNVVARGLCSRSGSEEG
jgi:hypothetical protein